MKSGCAGSQSIACSVQGINSSFVCCDVCFNLLVIVSTGSNNFFNVVNYVLSCCIGWNSTNYT